MGQALGRVLRDEDLDGPRGPDATLRVTVPGEWLRASAWIEIDLPRTLPCAACAGGGCDLCGRSGAVTTRGRKELPEIVDLRLPESKRGATVRLPKRGGLPEHGDLEVGRGILLLTVVPGETASDGVRRLPDEVAPIVSQPQPSLALPSRGVSMGVLIAVAVILLIALAVFTFGR